MNKIRKLLIFSCCIMIAAFAALWVSCKNSIPLVAEEPQVGVTQPTLTISSIEKIDTDKIRVSVTTEGITDSTEDGIKDGGLITGEVGGTSSPNKWIGVTTFYDGELAVLAQGYKTMPQKATYELTLPSGTGNDFYVYAQMSCGKGQLFESNVVDNSCETIVGAGSEYSGENQGLPSDLEAYKTFSEKYTGMGITYRRIDEQGNVKSDEISEIKDIGTYRVYGNISFSGSAKQTLPLGYFAICPQRVLQTKNLTYGEKLGDITLADGWEFISEKPQSDVKLSAGEHEYEVRYGEKIEITNNESLSNFIKKGLKYTENGKDYYYYDVKSNCWKSRFKVNVKAKDLSTDNSLTAKLEEPSVTCTGDTWAPEVTVSFKDETKLLEGTDYDVEFPKDMTTEGEKQIVVKFKGNYSGKRVLVGEILPSSWGKLVIDGDYKYWVDEDGTTSARITKGKNIWLKESSDGESTWYGLDNTNSVFTEGSRFWVKWLGRENDKEEWDKYYEQLDDEHKKKVEDNKLWIFLCGVTYPDGNEYTTLATSTNLYVQLGSDWDKDDVQAVFISQAIDEPVESIEYISDFKNSPTGTGDYAKLKLKHFSPYAVYDELTDEEREMLDKILNGDISEDELNDMISEAEPNEPTVPDNNDSLNNFESSEPSISYITGDQRGYVIAIAVCALIVAGVTLLFSLKSKKNKK